MKRTEEIIYTVLKGRPFSQECINEKEIYDAYCLRVAETVMMHIEDSKVFPRRRKRK
jgi:hypothetical protein